MMTGKEQHILVLVAFYGIKETAKLSEMTDKEVRRIVDRYRKKQEARA